jgi:hypothetical protein
MSIECAYCSHLDASYEAVGTKEGRLCYNDDPKGKNRSEEGREAMPTSQTHHPHTAKIYQFPVGGRGSVGPRGRLSKPLDLRASTVKTVADYDSWYHEAAIQEANRTYEH